MEQSKINELRALAAKQVETANRYADARKESGLAETNLKILLTAHLKEFRGNKKNIGIEMAIFMLCEDSEPARYFYKEWQNKESEYKGLEKILEATASQLIFEQSIMKRASQGEQYG